MMTGLIDYLHLRFHSNNNNNNDDDYNHDNEDNNSINTEYSSDNITVKTDTLRSPPDPNSDNNSSRVNDDGDNGFNNSDDDDDDEVDVSSIEMAKQFQLFKIQKPILSKNDILTFRKCRLHANHIKKQVTNNNDDKTIFSKNDKRSKTDNIPKYDDIEILSTQRNKSMKRVQSENDLKNSEYDDKWLRILKGVNRRNYTIGRKYTYIEERVWNNVSIQSLYSESPALDITAID